MSSITPELCSPFASPSWEPRFVVEHYENAALQHAVDLWMLSSAPEFGRTSAPVSHVLRRPDALLVAAPGLTGSGQPWDELPAPIAQGDLSTWIAAWLRTATYPKRPWFDGGEGQGFCVFWAHYGSTPAVSSGALVVLPKWFEIHK